MAHLCGAKTRSGSPCQSKAMPNGRCRMHGGKSTGAPKSNKNAVKAGGLYSRFLTDEENQLSQTIDLDSLDDEIRLTKIRLMRALKAEEEQQEKINELELDSYSEEPVLFGGAPDEDEKPIVKKQFKRKDYHGLIDRLTARIESLMIRRANLEHLTLDAEYKRDRNKDPTEGENKPIRVVLVGG